jgi:hypothetical protein
MRPRQWLLSAGFLAFAALKVAEVALGIERWPLTSAPMFARRVPPEVSPSRVVLRGQRDGRWVDLAAADFGLTPDELGRQLRGSEASLPGRCGLLGHVYNYRMRRPPAARLQALEARIVRLARSGGVASEQAVPCPIPPAPR